MKKTIQRLAVIGFAVLGFTQMNAQKGMKEFSEKDIQEMKERRLEKMTKHLELSDNQISQIKNIEAKYADEEKALHEEMKAKHEANKSKHEAMKEEMNAILTPEQREKFENRQKKHEGKRGGHGMKNGMEGRGSKHFGGERGDDSEDKMDRRLNKMKEHLGLSDAQVTQMKSIKEKYKPTEAEKAERKALMEKKKALRDKKMNEIKQILDTEQKAKMEKMQEKMQNHFDKRTKYERS